MNAAFKLWCKIDRTDFLDWMAFLPSNLMETPVPESLFDKVQACNFIKKETLGQVFSYEFCKISKNTFSYRRTPVDASAVSTNN